LASHPDLQAEQSHIDRAYERLEEMRAQARETLRDSLRQQSRAFQAVEEREVIVHSMLQRLEQLEIGREALVFGRIDRLGGEAFHIGRLAVSAEDQEPLVVDWRAPVAEPFYRATGRHPMGLARRRHFATEGRRLFGIEDEVFSMDGAGAADGDALVASGALLAALERSRSGQMRDIVATVQREQDEVIRAELPGVLVVQGGPGTGKTAVALHRAAYLLYTFRFPLERQGVLMVGPNTVFLRYISQVLPSLGETGVTLSTIDGLVGGGRVRGADTPLAARVKGDARMARVLARAVRDRQRPLRRGVEVGFGGTTLRLTAADSEHIVALARRRPGPHNPRRRFVEAHVFRLLHAQLLEALDRRERTGLRAAPDDDTGTEAADEEGRISAEDLAAQLRRQPELAAALDRMWPVLLPDELVHDLFGAPALIALAARGALSAEERAALERPRSPSLETIPWAPADLPLLDEARVLLGSRKAKAEELRTYGHIVVDEAQDLTPMQLRMLTRRSLSGSMTVVGDIAQATGHHAPSGWADVTRHLPDRKPAHIVELSVNYRTPAEIMEVASRVLAAVSPELRPPQSVRSTGQAPVFVDAADSELTEAVAAAVRAQKGDVGGGTVAVISPPSRVDALAAGLRDAGLEVGSAEADGLDTPVTLIPVTVVKGLEFDGVVVVEPAAIVEESPQGLHALYVALTRATKTLTVVHAQPLPPPLQPEL
jgi:DNA helicase IV